MKKQSINVRHDFSPTEYKEGDSWSKQYKVVESKQHYIVIAKTFKNGKPKVMTKKIIFADKTGDNS